MEENREVTKLLNYAYRYLGYRARSRKEMVDYFQRKSQKFSISPHAIELTLQYLEEEGYINDKEFIESYISSRNNSKPKSTYVLTLELIRKGIDKEFITAYFQDHPQDEQSMAQKALRKKWSYFLKLSPEIRYKKAADFLRRRGFSYDVAKKTIEELLTEE